MRGFDGPLPLHLAEGCSIIPQQVLYNYQCLQWSKDGFYEMPEDQSACFIDWHYQAVDLKDANQIEQPVENESFDLEFKQLIEDLNLYCDTNEDGALANLTQSNPPTVSYHAAATTHPPSMITSPLPLIDDYTTFSSLSTSIELQRLNAAPTSVKSSTVQEQGPMHPHPPTAFIKGQRVHIVDGVHQGRQGLIKGVHHPTGNIIVSVENAYGLAGSLDAVQPPAFLRHSILTSHHYRNNYSYHGHPTAIAAAVNLPSAGTQQDCRIGGKRSADTLTDSIASVSTNAGASCQVRESDSGRQRAAAEVITSASKRARQCVF